MTISQLRVAVHIELDRRNLKNPQIRKRALEHVLQFISDSEYLVDGIISLPSDKNVLKEKYKQRKGSNLSGAESSVINEIYNQYNLKTA